MTTLTDNPENAPAHLGKLLAAELARIQELEAALDAEHDALVGGDPDVLESATRSKNAALAAQQEQQTRRVAWLQSQGLDGDAPLATVIAEIGGTERHEELLDAMIRHATHCQVCNRRNGALIQRLQARTRGALNILRQSDVQPTLYSTSGQREASDDSRSLGKA